MPAGNLPEMHLLLHICLNALVVNSVWSQGLAVAVSPSVTEVPLMITVFY